MSRWVGRCAGRLAYYTVPRVRRVGYANIRLAYGESKSRKERRLLLKSAVENVGVVAAEFSSIARMNADFVKRHVIFEGLQNIPKNQGSIIIGAHLGNWEWIAPALAALGYKVAEVVRPLDHPPLNRYVDRVRTRGNVVTIPKYAAAVRILSLLKQKYCVGILVDQAQRKNAVPAQFFGQPCWSTVGPIILALRARVPVIPLSMTRIADGRYRLEFYPKIQLQHSEDWINDLSVNVQRCQDVIEQIVRKHPEQWLWIHRRWITRPKLEEEWHMRLQTHYRSSSEGCRVDVPPAKSYDRQSQ